MTGTRHRKPIGLADQVLFRTRGVTSTQACRRETEPNEAGPVTSQLGKLDDLLERVAANLLERGSKPRPKRDPDPEEMLLVA